MTEFLAWLTGLIGLLIPGFGASQEPFYNGYIEADYVYVASIGGGQITNLAVDEGDLVKKGELLFALDQGQQLALLGAAELQVSSAEAALLNLQTGGRPDEVDVTRRALAKAQSDLVLATEVAARSEKLYADGQEPKSTLDTDRSNLASAQSAQAQAQAQLNVVQLPGREAQQQGAVADVAVAKANADKARADLADRTVLAPIDGRIERTFFKQGETSAPAVPVLTLLPANSLKIEFYLPEGDRERFTLGDKIAVSCDGCPSGLTATLTFMASDPQFTPPVIYSRDERQRLSFNAEATVDPGITLHPGQPVVVELQK